MVGGVAILSNLLLLTKLTTRTRREITRCGIHPTIAIHAPLRNSDVGFGKSGFAANGLLGAGIDLSFSKNQCRHVITSATKCMAITGTSGSGLFCLFTAGLHTRHFVGNGLGMCSPTHFRIFMGNRSGRIGRATRSDLSRIHPATIDLHVSPRTSCRVIVGLLSDTSSGVRPVLGYRFRGRGSFTSMTYQVTPSVGEHFSLFGAGFNSQTDEISLSPGNGCLLAHCSSGCSIGHSEAHYRLARMGANQIVLPGTGRGVG